MVVLAVHLYQCALNVQLEVIAPVVVALHVHHALLVRMHPV